VPNGPHSLLAGRNHAPLSESDIRRAINTFLGLDPSVNVRYDGNANTHFHVVKPEGEPEYGEIVFGPDIYPGPGIVDPNSALSLDAAAAHELTHYYRWRDKSELPDPQMKHLDEALTSLEAMLRYEKDLQPVDIRQLVADALQRMHLYLNELNG
jgi:hypothetical protein